MNTIFPFGFPAPTAFYLTLYLLTFVLHQVFMHYVLAGSLYVAWASIWPGNRTIPRAQEPLAATLRDWMPFLLSAAITAGVAPLLFIQIVYQRQFYTANLLLWWRWMLVVPALIAGFYLLYLIKSSMLWRWPYPVRVAIAVTTSLSFVFVGFSWTVNHLLASSGMHWPEVYSSGRLPFAASVIVTRMLIWIGGSFATMSVIVGWQLLYRQALLEQSAKAREEGVSSPDANTESTTKSQHGGAQERVADARHSVRTLARLAGVGLIVALLAGVAYLANMDSAPRGIILGNSFLPYLVVTLAGWLAQGIGWTLQWRSDRFSVQGLVTSSAGMVASVFGASVVREGLRVTAIDLSALAQRHADAAKVGGFGVFLFAAIVVAVVMVWCVRLVQTGEKGLR